MTERYKSLSIRLKEHKEGAFIPFVALDDPDIGQSLKTIDALIEAGADALELGIPLSDPLADGPTIQSTALRIFMTRVIPVQCFEVLALIHQKRPTIPIGLLMYANLIFNKGIDGFYAECEKVSVDPMLVTDAPAEESTSFRRTVLHHNVVPIFIYPLNVSDDLLYQVTSYGHDYTYLLSQADVTGTENRAALPLNHLIAKLKEYNAAPPLQGFGVSVPDQVEAVADAEAAGAISSPAIVEIIEQHINEPERMLVALKALV